MTNADPTIGVLSLHTSKETKAILNAIEALGYRGEWLTTGNLEFEITGNGVAFEPDVDVVVNRLLLSNTEYPAEQLGLAGYFSAIRPVLNQPRAVLTAMHKLYAAAVLATAGVPVPDVYLALDPEVLRENTARFGELPVYKTAIGTHGGGTWRIEGDQALDPFIGQRLAFLQRFVATPGDRHHDLRVYVVDGRVVAAMARFAPDDEWRTNIALGGEPADRTAELPPSAAELAVSAASAVELDYAGVDLIGGGDEWFVLEVNPTPGFKGLFDATGVSPAPYIARAAIERGGGSVDGARVEELSAALDDSRPARSPKPRREAPDDQMEKIIGYTERVVVAGTSGSESVIAKADTGATRTSIDLDLAARIGAGPITRGARVKSGSQRTTKTRPVVDIIVGIGGDQYTVAAPVADRGHMTYPLLLGRDVLEGYHVDVTRRVEEEEVSG